MKRGIIILAIVMLVALPMISVNGAEIKNPLKSNNFVEFIDYLTNGLFWLGIAIAPMFFLIAAFYLLTAVGNTAQIETGKRIIVYTVIGLVIIIMAKGLVAFVTNII